MRDKLYHHKQLSQVWSQAAKELSEAINIFVIGYSLPESDAFFRYLYSLGSVGSRTLQRFWVFNPDDNVEKRFNKLLGPGAEERFYFYKLKFFDAIRIIKKEFSPR